MSKRAYGLSLVWAAVTVVALGGFDEPPGPAVRYGHPEPHPRIDGAIRIATYNLLNLFDHVDDPTLSGDIEDLDLAVPPDRARRLAETIRDLDADVLGLQEVESEEALRWFRDTYLDDLGYDHLASHDAGNFRGIECSVLSRFPIERAELLPQASLSDVARPGPGWSEIPPEHRTGMEFRRRPLVAEIRVSPEYTLTVLVLHHKSGGDYRFQREAEAVRIIEMLDELPQGDPSRNVVVMGDFNAAPWDKSFRLYLEAGFVDTMGHRIIPRWRDADQTEARLFKTHESDRVIDYILLNAAAYAEFVPRSGQVVGTVARPEGYDWRTDPLPPGYASDHYPLAIDLVPRNGP